MKNNYLHYTFFGAMLLLFFCIPNHILGNEKSDVSSNNSSKNINTTRLSFLTNSISFMSSAVHTNKVGFMAEADSFKSLDGEFGCYVEMPALQVDGTCVQASEAPNSYGDEVEFMWLERRNDEFIPLTEWSTNTALNFCPDTAGYYRLCARTVGCSDIYEATEVYVTEICTITVDAGDDIEVCQQESIVLTATAENENTCTGSCVYPIIESDRCSGGNPSEIWMSNSGNNFFNTTIHSNFEIREDGTAIYESQVFNGTDTLDVHITFTGRTSTPPSGSPKLGCDTGDTSEYVYWTTTTGTIVSENHGTYQLTRMGEAFQLGIGGDVTRTGLGASGWFNLTGGDGFYTRGDVNIKLGECVSNNIDSSVDYVWTTANGNIVGDTNQQSITVNQSGTYQVKAKDCADCEAIDEVIVEISTVSADAGEDVSITSGSSTILTATGGGSYVWSTGETTASITVSPTETTSYSVMVTSDNGVCTDADVVVVTVDCDLNVNVGEDLSFCSETETVLTATVINNTNSASIIASYNVTDADTSNGICENVHGNEQGVILQKGNTDFPITGSYNAWKVYNELILNEYDDNTAKISGTVIDEQGKIGTVDMLLYDKQNEGKSWSAQCYLDGLVGPQVFYQSFYGTITVDGVSYTVEPKVSKHHFVFAEGASLESNQFGFGAWTAGTFGNGGEWFGNLEPREFNNCEDVTYLWSTGETTPAITVSPESTTTYSVTVQNCDNCEVTDSLTIELNSGLVVDAGTDIEICEETEIALTASAAVNRNTFITNSYKVTNGDTTDKSCFPTKGTGVLFTRGEGCAGYHDIWQAGDDLIFNEYSNGTAVIKGSLTRNGKTAALYIGFSNKETSGSTWSASCYLDNVGDNRNFYQEFSGTLSYDGIVETIEKKTVSERHFITADGAGFEAGQLGLGGWLGGSVGECTEWFANLTPIEIEDCEVSYLWSNGETTQTILVSPEATTTYTVTATSCDSCVATDEVTVTVTPGITIDAGDDVEVCQEESVVLSASIENESTCVGGCEYPIIESERCAGGNIGEIWMMNDGTNMFNTTLHSSFKVFDDGTATYVSKVSNGTDILDVNILFTGRTTIAPVGSPKLGCDTDDTSGYVYYTHTSGTVISQNHGTFQVSRMGEAFQLGIGGDVARTGFGASGWFYLNGGDGHYDHGDVNIKLGECVTILPTDNVDYVWTTQDGNIVGEANQESITVSESGTYKIVAKNCKNCEAEDEVKVTITNPQSGEMTADAGTVCLENDVATISATSNGSQNIPTDYTQAYVLTSGDNLIIQGLSTNPEFEVSASGKYTIHSFVYPTSFDPLSVVTIGTTTGGDVNTLLIQGGGSLCASLDVAGAMVIVNDKLILGDFVWIDENQNGLQDNGEIGVNGVTATLFQNDGTEISNTTTANDPVTDELGAYQFEVCPNSGEYYIIFTAIPNGYEITGQNTGNDELDSDINNNGRTDTFNVLGESILSIDAGIFLPCSISPEITSIDSICIGKEVVLTAIGGDIFQWKENGTDIQGATSATLSVFPNSTTTYSVMVTDSAQFECSGEVSKEIIVYELPTANAGEDAAICVGEEITLTATGGDAYLWSNGEITNSITVSPQATTEYSVTVSSAQGCEDIDTILVTVNELPTANAGEDVAICVGEEITLTAAGGDTYLWSNGETTNSITVNPQATTEYNVTVSTTQGCDDMDTVLVTVNELPIANAGENVAICFGNEITLTATGGDTYLWSNGETTNSITVNPQATTEYSVTVSSSEGCDDMDTVLVTVNELPVAHACEDQTICYGDGTVLTAEGGDSYLWSTGETTATITVSPDTTTEYSVTVSSSEGCEAIDTVIVEVKELPIAAAGEDVVICIGEETTLTATGGDSYLWSNGETTDAITVAPDNTTEYGVIVTSVAGCEDMDTVTVTVNQNVTIGDFVFEDMNGDGIQDAEDTGVNGVTVKLFECDSFYGNAHGNLVDTYVTSNNPITGASGYYSFDVCQNSGQYYIIFEDIPLGYNFTMQETAATDLDSNVNLDGVTTCFDVTDMDNTTIDAGLKAETCGMGIGSKVLPRDPGNVYTARNTDQACIGDNIYLWLFINEENLSNVANYDGEDMEGWSFTYEFPNGTTFTQDDSTNRSYRTQVYSLTEKDFGTYKISWTSPEGCNGLTRFDLSLAQECLKDGSRPTTLPFISMVYPVPALASSELSIVINTVNQSVEDTGNGNIQAYGLQTLLPKAKETVDAILYDTNGKIVGASKIFEVDRGRALVKYPLGNLATGNYILLISGKDWSDSKQIIIE